MCVCVCVCGSMCAGHPLSYGWHSCVLHGASGHFGHCGCAEWFASLISYRYVQLLKVDLSVLGGEGALTLQDVYKRVSP